MNGKWRTILTHCGWNIQMDIPATPDQLGYRIDNKSFGGQRFNLIQEAADAIDSHLEGGDTR